MTTLFISDLHLDEQRPEITALFLNFLKTEAIHADALYILGDLFEFWSGDDIRNELNDQVQDGLAALTQAGVPCYLTKGNRDFLVGKRFAKRTGVTILPDYKVVELDGKRILVAHGDTLCTLDVKYQAFRANVQPKWRQVLFLALPIFVRQAIADKIRGASRQKNQTKSMQTMDVAEDEVIKQMRSHNCEYLIHGHTHRPDVHSIDLDGKQGTRIVLGDWFEQGSVLSWQNGQFELSQRQFLSEND